MNNFLKQLINNLSIIRQVFLDKKNIDENIHYYIEVN